MVFIIGLGFQQRLKHRRCSLWTTTASNRLRRQGRRLNHNLIPPLPSTTDIQSRLVDSAFLKGHQLLHEGCVLRRRRNAERLAVSSSVLVLERTFHVGQSKAIHASCERNVDLLHIYLARRSRRRRRRGAPCCWMFAASFVRGSTAVVFWRRRSTVMTTSAIITILVVIVVTIETFPISLERCPQLSSNGRINVQHLEHAGRASASCPFPLGIVVVVVLDPLHEQCPSESCFAVLEGLFAAILLCR